MTVVPAQSERERKIRLYFPVILNEEAEGSGLPAKNYRARLTGEWVVRTHRFIERNVLREIQQIVEAEVRPHVGRGEVAVFDAMPSVVAELQRVLAMNQTKNGPPVVHGASVFARPPSAADVKAFTLPVNVDFRHLEVGVLSIRAAHTGKGKA